MRDDDGTVHSLPPAGVQSVPERRGRKVHQRLSPRDHRVLPEKKPCEFIVPHEVAVSAGCHSTASLRLQPVDNFGS